MTEPDERTIRLTFEWPYANLHRETLARELIDIIPEVEWLVSRGCRYEFWFRREPILEMASGQMFETYVDVVISLDEHLLTLFLLQFPADYAKH